MVCMAGLSTTEGLPADLSWAVERKLPAAAEDKGKPYRGTTGEKVRASLTQAKVHTFQGSGPFCAEGNRSPQT